MRLSPSANSTVENRRSFSSRAPRSSSRAPVKRGCTTIRSSVARSSTTSLARLHARTMVTLRVLRASSFALTSRRTSGRCTATRSIVRPAISLWRSRAMVSVSGSSGMTVKLSPPDVRPEVAAGKSDVLGPVRAAAAGLGEAVGDGGDRGDTTTGRRELPRRRERGPGVKEQGVWREGADLNEVPPSRRLGIPRGRYHGGDGEGVAPLELEIGRQPIAAGDCRQGLEEARPQQG